MKKIKGVSQHDASDCGAACLSSIARAYGYDMPVSRMRQLSSTERQGTSVMGLVEAAEKMGFIAKGIKGPPEALRSAPIPSIAHLMVNNNMYHYVVLTRIGKKRVKYMDPDGGCIKKEKYDELKEKWTGVLVVIVPGPAFEKKKDNPSLFRRFTELTRPFQKTLLQAFIGAILFSLLGLSTSLFVQKIVDFVLVNRNLNLLNLMGMAMLGMLVMRILISWFKNLFLLKAGHQVDAGLITGYYRHLLSLPQSFFDTMRTGEILSRINDAVKIRVFINHSLIEIAVAFMTIIITLTAMSFVSWQLCLLVASVLPFYFILYLVYDRVNKSVLRNLMEESAGLESKLVETIQAQRTIRSFGWTSWANDIISGKLTGVLRMSYKAGFASIITGHSGEFISGLITILLLWVGASKSCQGHLSPGELMSFYAMLGYLLAPLKSLGNLNQTFRDALIAADRLFQILDLQQENHLSTGIKVERIEKDIKFHNVHFRYGSRPELFKDLCFSIPFGKVTGIVGRSGSGKSSIAALIRGEYMPLKGNLMINNCDIHQLERTTLRRRISIVPQQIELFSGSILDNITPGEHEPDWKKILAIADQTGLIKLINQLPEGFYTEVGEHGLDLSGGERQRIAFARALYSNPDVLILDESTAALDAVSESEILNTISKLKNDSLTIILITHKLSLIRDVDHIVLIDNGKAPESGRHEELMQLNGEYRQLWQAQNTD